MPPRVPTLLRLRRELLVFRDAAALHVSSVLRPRPCWLPWVLHLFAFRNDEQGFALALLSRCTQLWVYRSNQQRACGDFVIVDLSAADPRRRPVWVVDLKQGAPLREGGGGAGVQLRYAGLAVEALARAGVVGAAVAPRLLTGSAELVLEAFTGGGGAGSAPRCPTGRPPPPSRARRAP